MVFPVIVTIIVALAASLLGLALISTFFQVVGNFLIAFLLLGAGFFLPNVIPLYKRKGLNLTLNSLLVISGISLLVMNFLGITLNNLFANYNFSSVSASINQPALATTSLPNIVLLGVLVVLISFLLFRKRIK